MKCIGKYSFNELREIRAKKRVNKSVSQVKKVGRKIMNVWNEDAN